jgi:hypothetical protein
MGDLSTLLRVVRTEPATAGDTGDEKPASAQEAPVQDVPAPARNLITLHGDRMGFGDQAKAAAGHAWRIAKRRAKDAREREGSVVAGLARAKLPSIEEQCQYARSRAWVPPGHEDGIAAAMGVVFHALIGRPGVAAANLAGALCARPFRACTAAGAVLVSAEAFLIATHRGMTAALIILAVTLIAALWICAGLLWLRITAPPLRPPPAYQGDDDEDVA